jgi:IMP dehydrogenase/GMP reductase
LEHSLIASAPLHERFKKYRGSASKESYEVQGKDQSYITAEGESFLTPYKGGVSNILKDIEGGLRSAFTYVGARTLKEFHERVEFVQVSPATVRENGAHGKA